jgi:hypothetical protein
MCLEALLEVRRLYLGSRYRCLIREIQIIVGRKSRSSYNLLSMEHRCIFLDLFGLVVLTTHSPIYNRRGKFSSHECRSDRFKMHYIHICGYARTYSASNLLPRRCHGFSLGRLYQSHDMPCLCHRSTHWYMKHRFQSDLKTPF